jgi:hypothetical protein
MNNARQLKTERLITCIDIAKEFALKIIQRRIAK